MADLLRTIAAQEVLPRWQSVRVDHKADGSLLSDADTAVQRALAESLPSLYPAPLLGEESSPALQTALWDSSNLTSASLWIADPIDGTTNFVHGLPYFAISVALVQQGRSILGVIYNPASNEMFYARKGDGAYLNGTPLPLKASPSFKVSNAAWRPFILALTYIFLTIMRTIPSRSKCTACGQERNALIA